MSLELTPNMKAGFQGKRDAMRAMAERLLGKGGHAADVYDSKSCAEKSGMRPYKKGGRIESKESMHHLDHKGHSRDESLPHRKMHGHEVTHRHHDGHEHHSMKHHIPESYLQGQGNEPLDEHGYKHQMHHRADDVFHELADKPMKVRKFAMGGVGKIRHEEATASGEPLYPKQKSYKYNM